MLTIPATGEEDEEVPSRPTMVYDLQGKLVEASQYVGTVYLSTDGYIDH